MIFIEIALLSCLVPYLLGSLSFSIIVSRLLFHKDVREFGSGNAGMTNILRTFGKGAAALTLIGDMGKGFLAVWLNWKFIGSVVDGAPAIFCIYLAAFFAVIGHIYPVFFGFKGGKAVAVSAGTIIGIQPLLVLPLLVIFAVVLVIWKMVSLSSISCAVAYPIVTFCYYYFSGWYSPEIVATATVGSVIVAALVIWLHRGNIARIKAGTEYKFFQKRGRDQ